MRPLLIAFAATALCPTAKEAVASSSGVGLTHARQILQRDTTVWGHQDRDFVLDRESFKLGTHLPKLDLFSGNIVRDNGVAFCCEENYNASGNKLLHILRNAPHLPFEAARYCP